LIIIIVGDFLEMLIAICGIYNDIKAGSIRGNGKNITAVYLAYKDYLDYDRKIYTNFKTNFSENYTMNELIELFKDRQLRNSLIIIDEAQIYLNNSGVKVAVIRELIQRFLAQSRKEDIDIIVISQRFSQLHKQLREHIDVVLIPIKYHITDSGQITTPCKIDNCKKEHAILVYSVNANNFLYQDNRLVVLNPSEIGKLYDSNEIVLDDFEVKKESKPKKRMVNKKSVRKSKDKLMALPLEDQLKYLKEVREEF